MTFKHFCTLLTLLLSTHLALAQNKISGELTDPFHDPISFARVSLTDLENDSTRLYTTGYRGTFSIDSLPLGRYTLKFEMIGYEPIEMELELKADTIIRKIMEPLPYEMMEFEVVGYKVPLIERDDQPYTIVKMVPKDCDLDTTRKEGTLHPQEMRDFFLEHLDYPEYSIAELEQGRVYVSFRIDSEGNIRDIEILRGVSECLDNRVISALSCMPVLKMKPKLPNGRYSRYGEDGFEEGEYRLPVTFILE